MALSSRPANLRGKQGKIVIDEAAFHDDLPGLLKAAMAMLMWGGRVVVISTHNGDDHPFNELVTEIRAGKKPYSLHRVTIDDALEQGLYRRICLRLGKSWTPEAETQWRNNLFDFYGDDADEELLCIPAMGGGAYLTRVMIEGIMSDDVPVLRWTPPAMDFVHWSDVARYKDMADWCEEYLEPTMQLTTLSDRCSWFGEDFGRTCDLTVIWPLQSLPGLSYHTPFVLELRDCPFTQQEQVLFFPGGPAAQTGRRRPGQRRQRGVSGRAGHAALQRGSHPRNRSLPRVLSGEHAAHEGLLRGSNLCDSQGQRDPGRFSGDQEDPRHSPGALGLSAP